MSTTEHDYWCISCGRWIPAEQTRVVHTGPDTIRNHSAVKPDGSRTEHTVGGDPKDQPDPHLDRPVTP